jgi:hypothetical protein
MKRSVLSLLVLASLNTWSCPDLSGSFTCKDFDTNAHQDVVISQEVVDGSMNYTVQVTSEGETTSRLYIADGETRDVESDAFSSRTETSSCKDGSLIVDIKGVTAETNENLDAVVTIKIDENNNLFDSYTGTQGENELNFSETCERVN